MEQGTQHVGGSLTVCRVCKGEIRPLTETVHMNGSEAAHIACYVEEQARREDAEASDRLRGGTGSESETDA